MKRTELKNKSALLILANEVDKAKELYEEEFKEYLIARPEIDVSKAFVDINKFSLETLDSIKCKYRNRILALTNVQELSFEDLTTIFLIIHKKICTIGLLEGEDDLDYLYDKYMWWQTNMGLDPACTPFFDDPYYAVDDLVSEMDDLPDNKIIGFISDNDEFMNSLFDTVVSENTSSDDTDDEEPGDVIESKKHFPLTKDLPRIFEGWIWRIWYSDRHKNELDLDIQAETVADDSVESYVARTVVVNMGGATYTYIWIKPSVELDLTSILSEMQMIWFDVCTDYKKITRCFEVHPVTFIKHFISKAPKEDYENLNVLRNSMYIDNVTRPERNDVHKIWRHVNMKENEVFYGVECEHYAMELNNMFLPLSIQKPE